jgi:scyllo-inositol 2-dehydrogenase (NADP+)
VSEHAAGTVDVGLIGFGAAGSILHASLIDAADRLRLRIVATARRELVGRAFPEAQVVATSSELLDHPGIDLVVVSVPNAVHHELVRAALLAGKHVVVDKPFVPSCAEADELIELAARTGRLVSVFHNRRWDNDFLTVERCVGTGLLGTVSTYIARYDRFRPVPKSVWVEEDLPGSGLLYDLGSHLVDQALHLFGVPETVVAEVRTQRSGAVVDDYFQVLLGYGVLRVILHAGSLVRAPGPRFEVHGDRGSFVKHGIDPQEAALRAGRRPGDPGWGAEPEARYGTLTTEIGGLAVTGRLATLPGAYESFYRQMARAILEGDAAPVPAEEARTTIRVIECARQSSREGCLVTMR